MIAFWSIAIILILSAVWVVTAKKPVYSVVGLLAHFAALAALYLTLNAEFIAAMQIIVYSGAILILFLFVIALLSSGVAAFDVGPNRMKNAAIPAAVFVVICAAFVLYAVASGHGVPAPATTPAPGTAALAPAGTADAFGSVADFGKALFTVQLLPFEITALILMVAVVGVVLLAGDAAPYQATTESTKRRAAQVRREAREAIVRGGGQ